MNDKGMIALDIDGTVAEKTGNLHPDVKAFLKNLSQSGWTICFITGRTFSYAHITLNDLDFPYFFAVQNGADIIIMPSREVISRCYLDQALIPFIESAHEGVKEDILVYSGMDHGDFCYYRKSRFSKEMISYLDRLKALSKEPWIEVDRFDLAESYPLIKCMGSKEEMGQFEDRLKVNPDLAVSCIKDPLSDNYYVLLVTHKGATKGEVISRLKPKGKVIAAGDDRNDIPMLLRADVAIVMETAPLDMHQYGDVIAPSVKKQGIIEGLEKAINAL